MTPVAANPSCLEVSLDQLRLSGQKIKLQCLVIDVLSGFDLLIGMDAIKRMGGVRTGKSGEIEFQRVKEVAAAGVQQKLEINDVDFGSKFDEAWTVRWKWKDGKEPALENKVAEYS